MREATLEVAAQSRIGSQPICYRNQNVRKIQAHGRGFQLRIYVASSLHKIDDEIVANSIPPFECRLDNFFAKFLPGIGLPFSNFVRPIFLCGIGGRVESLQLFEKVTSR